MPTKLFSLPTDLWTTRGLAFDLFVKELRAKYRESILGATWTLLLPVLSAIACQVAISQHLITNLPGTAHAFSFQVAAGFALWQCFIDCVTGPGDILKNRRTLLLRIQFPHGALLGAHVLRLGFELLVRLSLVAGWGIGHGHGFWRALVVPALALPLFVAGTSLGLVLAPLTVMFRDCRQIIHRSLQALVVATPIVYFPHRLGFLRHLYRWNPLNPILEGCQQFLRTGNFAPALSLVVFFLIALTICEIGWLAYRRSIPILLERFGN